MNEIEESELLLSKASFPAVKKLLKEHISYLKLAEEHAAIKSPVIVPPAPLAVAQEPIAPNVEVAPAAPSQAKILTTKAASVIYIPIETFSWDQGEYGSQTLSIFIDLPGVGAIKDNVDFSCTKSTFDLKITGLEGKNYRLVKENLDKDIVVKESKILVKKDKIVIKLRKVKGDYSYENWSSLTSKKKRDSASEAEKKSNPMGGIMDMMKDMYDDGDENMKKIIGEAMMKSQRGEKTEPPSFSDDM